MVTSSFLFQCDKCCSRCQQSLSVLSNIFSQLSIDFISLVPVSFCDRFTTFMKYADDFLVFVVDVDISYRPLLHFCLPVNVHVDMRFNGFDQMFL
jgi:hypothetical protein